MLNSINFRTFVIFAFVVTILSIAFIDPAFAEFIKPQVVDPKPVTHLQEVIKKGVSFSLYAVMAMSVLGLVLSLGMMTPVIGQPDRGKQGVRGSLIVLVCAALFEMFVDFLIKIL